MNILQLTDEELKQLYGLLLTNKITATTQELLMLKLGKLESPVLNMTLKVIDLWEQREKAINSREEPEANPQN